MSSNIFYESFPQWFTTKSLYLGMLFYGLAQIKVKYTKKVVKSQCFFTRQQPQAWLMAEDALWPFVEVDPVLFY